MPGPSQKNPQRIARMLKMHRAGASAREIASELKISHVAAARWLKESGMVPNGGGTGRRDSRTRRELEPDVDVVAGAQQTIAEVEAGMPLDRSGALAHLTMRLKQVAAIVKRLSADGCKGTLLMADFDKAVKLEQAL